MIQCYSTVSSKCWPFFNITEERGGPYYFFLQFIDSGCIIVSFSKLISFALQHMYPAFFILLRHPIFPASRLYSPAHFLACNNFPLAYTRCTKTLIADLTAISLEVTYRVTFFICLVHFHAMGSPFDIALHYYY